MNNEIFFRPFVGASYNNGGLFGKRIMVLGESHYCDEGCTDCGNSLKHRECTEFTKGVVESYLDERNERQRWMQTFLKFERSLVGKETDQSLRLRIWQSLVFYNYLQVAMGGPREAGTVTQYRECSEVFFDVMEKYQPQYIIVWGNRLWENLPNKRWIDDKDIMIDGYRVATGRYMLECGKYVKVMAVNHPSVGYSWDYWYRVISEFLK